MFEYKRVIYSKVPNNLIQSLLSQPHNIHYLNRYLNFIQHMQMRSLPSDKSLYTEKHHIVPKSYDITLYNDPFNIVKLTPREHFIAHYIFAKAFGGKHWMSVNIIALCENPYQHRRAYKNFSSKLYENAKIEEIKYKSLHMTEARAKETEVKKTERINKWRLNSNRCDKCSVILRGDVSNHVCKEIIPTKQANICTVCDNEINKNSTNQEICISCLNSKPRICKRCDTNELSFGKKICDECRTKTKRKNKNNVKVCVSCESLFNTIGNNCRSCNRLMKQRKKEEHEKRLEEHEKRLEEQSIQLKNKKNFYKNLQCDECGSIPNKNRNMIEVDGKTICKKCDTHLTLLKRYGENYKEISQSEKLKIYLNSLSEEERKHRNETTSKGVLEYYKNDAYDHEKRSLEVKNGLAKNKIHQDN